jgi:hypothetical protein
MMTKKNRKKFYIVHVVTHEPHYKPKHKYIHLDVVEFYREGDRLIIKEYKGKRDFIYDLKMVKEIRVRETVEGVYWKNDTKK